MSKGTIKYSQEFKSMINGNQWIGIDMVVNDVEQWDEKFKEALELVKGFSRMADSEYNKTYSTWAAPPQTNYFPAPTTPLQSIDRKAIERLEILIDDAKSIQDLMDLKPIAYSNEYGLQKQYDTKFSQLKNNITP